MSGSVYSMTGYSIAKHLSGLTIDVRTVNSRFLDITLKVPDVYKHLEGKLREMIAQQLKRGKFELRLSLTPAHHPKQSKTDGSVDLSRLKMLLAQQEQIRSIAPNAASLTVAEMLHLMTSFDQQRDDFSVSPIPDNEIMATCLTALRDLTDARALEGGKLAQAMLEGVEKLARLHSALAPLVPALIEQQKQRFLQKLNDAAAIADGKMSASAAQERVLCEVTAFAIRIDIHEELDRLSSHLTEIKNLLSLGADKEGQGIGKRLEFLIQELHREVNTVGSKSATLATTRIAVDMKVIIEQLREQIQNIE